MTNLSDKNTLYSELREGGNTSAVSNSSATLRQKGDSKEMPEEVKIVLSMSFVANMAYW